MLEHQEETNDFTMCIKEFIICTVFGVSGDALHPPLWNALMRRAACKQTAQEVVRRLQTSGCFNNDVRLKGEDSEAGCFI